MVGKQVESVIMYKNLAHSLTNIDFFNRPDSLVCEIPENDEYRL